MNPPEVHPIEFPQGREQASGGSGEVAVRVEPEDVLAARVGGLAEVNEGLVGRE
jgi:hypothetical protein